MSLLVVGSVAFDALESPYGKMDRALGGAATYFAVAASFLGSWETTSRKWMPGFFTGVLLILTA